VFKTAERLANKHKGERGTVFGAFFSAGARTGFYRLSVISGKSSLLAVLSYFLEIFCFERTLLI
jgi:hypothetical protein